MKHDLVPLFCSALCLANWIAIGLNAQATGKASVQSHLAAGKNAAYEPGNDLTVLYDRCVVRFRTHSLGGISDTDFECAARTDALVA